MILAFCQIASYAAIFNGAVSSALTISAGDLFAKSFSDWVKIHASFASIRIARACNVFVGASLTPNGRFRPCCCTHLVAAGASDGFTLD